MQEEPGVAISLTTPLEPVQNLQKTLQRKQSEPPRVSCLSFSGQCRDLVFVVIFWRTHHRDHRNWLVYGYSYYAL